MHGRVCYNEPIHRVYFICHDTLQCVIRQNAEKLVLYGLFDSPISYKLSKNDNSK